MEKMDEVPINDKPLRVVATFTTLPDRYSLVENSIKSIRAQDYPVDAIYLTIPRRARRLKQEYPPVPDTLSELCTIIRIDIDYGPITKIYGALVSETNPDTIIISCDDDIIHHPRLVRTLVNHHKQQANIAICGTGALIGRGLPLFSIFSSLHPFRKWNGFTGFEVGENGRAIDVIFGVAGVLYLRGFFPDINNLHSEIFKYCFENEAVFLNDDILISGYLSRRNITRKVFSDIPDAVCQHENRADALSHDLMVQMTTINRSINYLKEKGFFPLTESIPLDETIMGRTIILIIIVVLILVLAFFLYRIL